MASRLVDMKYVGSVVQGPSAKAPTGISGFDVITGGGLPRGRTTLVTGGPGSGKTMFAMQFLAQGIRIEKEPGIFVAFEESPKSIAKNFENFSWSLTGAKAKGLFILDAQPSPELVHSGNFDLIGLLAALGAKSKAMGARRVAIDAIDILLALLPNDAARRREIYRLHSWLLASGLTGLITAKSSENDAHSHGSQPMGFVQFMADCTVVLSHRVDLGVSQRGLRVQKYRGSSFDENESPFVIGSNGFDVAVSRALGRVEPRVSSERVTSGVKRLDTMLGGGYFRGSSVLITGFPGTAKTTLSGAFAEAACRRGERTTFVGFDSDVSEVVRNLTSVGIRLGPYVKNGLLHMISARTITGSAETLLVRIKSITKEHKARCLVIDPVSTLSKAGNESTAHGVAERLIDWCKADRITLVCTSLLDSAASSSDAGTPLQISTLADTWIHLNYLLQSGERNRGLSIIKSRGMSHSNQVRELILSSKGVTLADIYTAGGEVLMGTLRWEKERAEVAAHEIAEVSGRLTRAKLVAEEAELEARLATLRAEHQAKKVEKVLFSSSAIKADRDSMRRRAQLRKLRGNDSFSQRRS